MKRIELSDVLNILEYEKVREASRDRIIKLKKDRRIPVGDLVTFLFENRDTVLFQIQEMVRAERIISDRKIQDEIDVYNELLPEPGSLSATMFIEIQEEARIKPTLEKFLGITRPGCVSIQVGQIGQTGQIGDQLRVDADFEQGREEEASGKVSAVQYGKFPFTAEDRSAFLSGEYPISLVIDHPNYQARTVLGPAAIESLKRDLES